MNNEKYAIAIDGPAGAGKSTIARGLAEVLGFTYVDTGALYRAMACYFLENHIDAKDEAAIAKACDEIHVGLSYEDGAQHVILNDRDVSGSIRTETVGNMASATSGYACVRAKLLTIQRQIANERNVIMDGRDIGTSVLPDAQLKIYLTASVETRAMRRYKELTEKGQNVDLQKIQTDIRQRDEQDMTRAISPLRQALDAKLVDTSELSIQGVIDLLFDLAVTAGIRKDEACE